MRKRQEVGRGVRLAVDQRGEREHEERLNVLTVVANESYERFVAGLQSEIALEYQQEIEKRYKKSIADLSEAERAAIAEEYGFWLGDAFASGGSAGYDHKALGITSRGAWKLVARHFRELRQDIEKNDFTVVGVGDMSGDVLGNGMLRSKHTKLVAAFNHLHIFLDPDPDPAKSFAERQRLFDLPRSSWADYDKTLLSAGRRRS